MLLYTGRNLNTANNTMLFDLFVCIRIVAITPMLAIIFPMSCLALYRRMTSSTVDNRNKKAPKLLNWIFPASLISSPFLVAMSGILNHPHHWEWYLGCLLCGMLSFCIFCFCVFPAGRQAFKRNYAVLIPLTTVLALGIFCITVRS